MKNQQLKQTVLFAGIAFIMLFCRIWTILADTCEDGKITVKQVEIFAQNVKLISFTLKDQFDREYTEKSFSDKILVVIAGDRDGSKFSDSWQQAIYDALEKRQIAEQVQFIRVADLRGAPWFLYGFIKGKFPKEKDHWSLMDWKGIFATTYGFELKSCNILVFDHQQRLVYKTNVQKPDPQKLEEIMTHAN